MQFESVMSDVEHPKGDRQGLFNQTTQGDPARNDLPPRGAWGSPVRCYRCEMKGRAEQRVERYLELSKKKATTLSRVATPCSEQGSKL